MTANMNFGTADTREPQHVVRCPACSGTGDQSDRVGVTEWERYRYRCDCGGSGTYSSDVEALRVLSVTRDHLRSLLDNHYDGPGRVVLYAADLNALEARLREIEQVLA